MLLTHLEIENYKSFFAKTTLQFGKGFNILLGANSSGKTSILEAIRFLDLPNIPHRSIKNIIEPDAPWNSPPKITARFDITINQLRKFSAGGNFPIVLNNGNGELVADIASIKRYWEKNDFSFEIFKLAGHEVDLAYFPCGERSQRINESTGHRTVSLATANEFGISYPSGSQYFSGHYTNPSIPLFIKRLNDQIYKFSAERVVRSTSGFSDPELAPDAHNLAFCINHLRASDDKAFDTLNKSLHRIFQNIYSVSAIPQTNGQFELKVFTLPSDANRTDLAVPMDRVGTGVSNAVAMLYVVLTARSPRIILLEEPNSFLHPRALRELLTILSELGSKHQFFVTTHSSDVLRSIRASTVTLLRNDGSVTTVEQTRQHDLEIFRAGLLDLGIKLTDLHGSDRVLWVEGETEEAIFPKLLEKYFPELAQGIAVLRLHATGDFEARKYTASKVADIYQRLSTATFLAPPMVAITLDREGKQQSQIDALERDSGGVIHFLPRVMIEDYLISPGAIEDVLRKQFHAEPSISEIDECIAKAKSKPENHLNPRNPHDKTIHAAKVLHAVFTELGGDGASYDKAAHGPMLTDWILEHTNDFDELGIWFSEFIKP